MSRPYTIDIKQGKDKMIIIFSGELIINHIEEIYKQLVEEIDYSKSIDIKITNPKNIDLTFLQLLSSIENSFDKKDTKVQIEKQYNEEIYSLLANAGFEDQIIK